MDSQATQGTQTGGDAAAASGGVQSPPAGQDQGSSTGASTESQAQGAGSASTGQTQDQPRTSGDGWLRKLFGGSSQQSGSDEQADSQGDGQTDEAKSQGRKPINLAEGDPNEVIPLTREEARRLVQSEKDRTIAAENRRNAEMANRRATAEQLDRLREFSDPETGDPDKLAEVVREILTNQESQREVAQRQEELFSHIREVGNGYDRELLVPMLEMLPDKGEAIKKAAPENLIGLDHRAFLFKEGLKALQAHWTRRGEEQAKTSLRRNPAFQKEVLAERRGTAVEPELIEAVVGSNGHHTDTNTALRNFLR